VRVRKAYPAYFGTYSEIHRVRQYLNSFENLFPVGRNGMHRYNNQDHSMLAANAAVDCIVSGSMDKDSIWSVNAEDEYHEEVRAPQSDVMPSQESETSSSLKPINGQYEGAHRIE
jgi:hypothetical protein